MTAIEHIKSGIRFDDYAGRFLEIMNHKAKCPAHEEKTASLVIHETWAKCFGCGWHGDIIDFAALYHGISPRAAVRMLADELGIPFTRQAPVHPYDAAKAARIRAEADEWHQHVRAALVTSRNSDDWDRVAPYLARFDSLRRGEVLAQYTDQRTPAQAAMLRESIRESDLWIRAITPLIGTLIDRLASAPEDR